MPKNIYEKIKTAIINSEKVLITAHEKPDGDALGSVFSIAKYLDSLGKKYQIFLEGNGFFKETPFLHDVISYDEIDWTNIDLIISLDSGDLGRTGLKKVPFGERKIINIDHHVSNDYFGDINLVDSKSPSTTLVLTKMFNYFNFNIDKRIAKALLLGILTDTDNFSNKGTTIEAFQIAAELLKKGANMSKINFAKTDKKIDALKIWGNSFERLSKNKKYGGTYTVITKEEIKKAEDENFSENVEDLVNFFNNLKDSKFSMVLKEQEDGVKVSLRTTHDDVDVSKLASFFGGGGHKKAAGFFIKGKMVKGDKGWRVERQNGQKA
jgi:bifunctional oligoribonuclease and PAP phosphatase NrnA